jgi:hypothetical protein
LKKRDVSFDKGRLIVRANATDAVAKARQLNLRNKLAGGARWTDEERDWAILALLQDRGLV